ncbi:MAG: FAD-dependent oxidoreductase [Pseudomonadota bacterium]
MRVAIIGAGMAGLSAARDLKKADVDVCLFDKGRGPGGRMSTRRIQIGDSTIRFDHGAQYILPKTPTFQQEIARWVSAGVAAEWTGRRVNINEHGDITSRQSEPVYVGTPGMNEIIRHLAVDHRVSWGRRVETIQHDDQWTVIFDDKTFEGGFDAVILAVPAEQVRALLLSISTPLTDMAASVKSDPCWTVIAAFESKINVEWDGASMSGNPISWAARNSSKPSRGDVETWVLQASAEWSSLHLEDEKDAIMTRLLSAFASIAEPVGRLYAGAHRWRYSQIQQSGIPLYYFNAKSGLGSCGDWCAGPKIEDAWLSGRALAERILM